MNAPSIEIVQSEALWQRVVSALRRAIIVGELQPGSHLKEPVLAARFGVSRLPIREAIAQLDHEGLVRIEPRRGAFVIGLTEQDISDIYECRLMLELAAIRRAAPRIDTEGVTELSALVEQMDVAVANEQPQLFASFDTSFHRRLVTISGSRALVNAWEPVAPLIETILSISEAAMANIDLPGAVDGHRNIIRALAAHDIEAAEAILRIHLTGGEDLVYTALHSVRDTRKEAMLS
jgi:GntR family transcriptional regulator, gluconate operon transcriptional repressor